MAGNVAYAGARWGMLVVLTHVGNAAMMGQVVLAFAICAPILGFADLGLRTVLVTDARNEHRFGEYLRLRLCTSLLAMLVVVGFLLLTRHQATMVAVIAAVAVGRLFESLSDIFHGLLQKHERMDRTAIAMIVRELLGLVLMATGTLVTGSIAWGIWGFPLAMALTFFAYDLPNGLWMWQAARPGEGPPAAGGEALRRLARLAWLSVPVGGVLLMIRLNTNVPRYMVGYYLGDTALGVFAAVTALSVAGRTVVTALGQAAAPRMAQYYADGNRAGFARIMLGLSALVGGAGLVMVLAMALLGRPILALLYNNDVDIVAAADTATWIMLASALSYLATPLGRAVGAMRRFRLHMVLRSLEIGLMAALMPWLIPAHGLAGAAWSMVVGSSVAAVVTSLCVWRGVSRMERAAIVPRATAAPAVDESPSLAQVA